MSESLHSLFAELSEYANYLKDRIVFCNYHDSDMSHFWDYFETNFASLGMKQFISTRHDLASVEYIETMKESDIIITNPPFYMFRQCVAELFEYKKQFIIIGSQDALTYNEFFRLIRDKNVGFGCGLSGRESYIIQHSPQSGENPEECIIRIGDIGWFTNLGLQKRADDLVLYRTQN